MDTRHRNIDTMRLLVTGGAGYIGSHVVKALGDIGGHEIVVVDNLSTGDRRSVLGGRLIEADLGQTDALREVLGDFRPDAVFHLAASSSVEESVTAPLFYYRNNTSNTIALVECMTGLGIRNLIFASTSAVYGDVERMPASEDASPRPLNPYGRSKMACELVLRDAAAACRDFRYVALRCFNVAGADASGRIGPRPMNEPSDLIGRALKATRGEIDAFHMFGSDYPTPDGTCIRDYVHVDDVAAAHVLALSYLIKGGTPDLFNCGSGRGYSVREVLDAVRRVTGAGFAARESARRTGDPAVMVADCSKIGPALGWSPSASTIEAIVESAWAWARKSAAPGRPTPS